MIAIWGNEVQIVESAFLKLFGPVRDEKVHGSTHYFAEYGGTGVCAVQEQDRTETKRTEQELRRDLEALVELNKEFRDLYYCGRTPFWRCSGRRADAKSRTGTGRPGYIMRRSGKEPRSLR